MNLAEATILITGASRGIGRHLALHFAALGAEILITARSEPGLHDTAQAVERVGGRCLWQTSDLCRPDSLERLAGFVSANVRHVDLLINNAADLTSRPFLETPLPEIDSILRTNLTGLLQLTRLIAPMLTQPGGMIINLSSLAGYKPNPAQTVYSISKAAVNGASDALRAELAPKGICVMNVAVPSVRTGPPRPFREISLETFTQKLERAIHRRADELYLSPLTKWLMRLYKFYPPLSRIT